MIPIRYRLPDILGGGEYDGEMNSTGAVACLEIPGVGSIEVPGACLTEVKPPQPPEPKPWAVVSDRHAGVWQRIGKEPVPWRSTDGRSTNWEALNSAYGPLTRLVPDPADYAPELPWKDDAGDARVHRGDTPDTISIEVTDGDYPADEAETIARAILRGVRAAREVEQP